jgi:hypothetical protein
MQGNHNPLPFLAFALSAVLLAWVVAIFRSLADQGMNTYLSHGRYIFVAMVPFAMLFILGLRAWVRESYQSVLSVMLILGLVVFDAVCFWGTLIPFYY